MTRRQTVIITPLLSQVRVSARKAGRKDQKSTLGRAQLDTQARAGFGKGALLGSSEPAPGWGDLAEGEQGWLYSQKAISK